jgi:hypothetical protein
MSNPTENLSEKEIENKIWWESWRLIAQGRGIVPSCEMARERVLQGTAGPEHDGKYPKRYDPFEMFESIFGKGSNPFRRSA